LLGVYEPSAFLLLPALIEPEKATVPVPLLAVTVAVTFLVVQLPLAVKP